MRKGFDRSCADALSWEAAFVHPPAPNPRSALADRQPCHRHPLVRRLVDAQFPHWAHLPLTPLEPAGSDHVIHRLGDGLTVRLPRHAGAVGQARKEAEWLPRLAAHVSLAVPEPAGVGKPAFGYPWPWAVTRWLEGEVATVETLGDSVTAAGQLAGFLTELQRFEPGAVAEAATRGDLAGDVLAARDASTRASIAATAGVFDAAAMTGLWEAALAAPEWHRPPVWFHGDFHTGNLLVTGGRLSAVIDFGGFGAGDPARDMMIAHTLLSPAPAPSSARPWTWTTRPGCAAAGGPWRRG